MNVPEADHANQKVEHQNTTASQQINAMLAQAAMVTSRDIPVTFPFNEAFPGSVIEVRRTAQKVFNTAQK